MLKILVEEDRILRLMQVILDPSCSAERIAAFADFNSTDQSDFQGWLEQTRTLLPRLYPAQIVLFQTEEEMHSHLPDTDILIVESSNVGPTELALATRLKILQNFGQLHFNVDAKACAARGIEVLTLRRRTNIAMAEHTMTLLLSMAKRMPLITGLVTTDRLAQAGYPIRPYDKRHTAGANFGRIPQLKTISGMRLGLLGLGEIGYEVAPLANAFGMQVSYHKRSRLPISLEEGLRLKYLSLEKLFAENDFVSVHIPFNEETTGLVNKKLLELMPNGSFLINTSRAQIVNEKDLIEVLQTGHIAGVGLDVMRQEPAAEDDPLLQFPQVLVTPHLGGASRMNGLNDAQEMLERIQTYLS
jgi:phosphoglycerate dehydrogenase-like enzyme